MNTAEHSYWVERGAAMHRATGAGHWEAMVVMAMEAA